MVKRKTVNRGQQFFLCEIIGENMSFSSVLSSIANEISVISEGSSVRKVSLLLFLKYCNALLTTIFLSQAKSICSSLS